MKSKRIEKVIIITLVVLEIVFSELTIKSLKNKPVELDEVKFREIKKDKNSFAIMLGDGSGGYTASEVDTFPTTGYKFNSEKSGCIDNEGNKLEGVLSYENQRVLVNTGGTTYCYVYFDKETFSDKLVENPIPGVLEPTGVAEDELATRYYGTNPANYICFGTSDKNTCVNDTDKYMYRIIGIDKQGRYKVIKKEALNTSYSWHTEATDINWEDSSLKASLNGSEFLSNTTYMPTDWNNKIATINWKYGDFTDYNDKTATEMIQIEQGWTNTTPAKIGLMYIADYYYAYQKAGLNCGNSGQFNTCKTSWMHINQNDNTPPNSYEWTMSRYSSGASWYVNSDGRVNNYPMHTPTSARPVFYIVASAEISGSGTIDDPYLITN